MKHISIRMLLAMVAWFDLEHEQLNVKTTFLHGELEEQIFASTRRIRYWRQRRSCVQVKEISLWFEAVT